MPYKDIAVVVMGNESQLWASNTNGCGGDDTSMMEVDMRRDQRRCR